MQRRIGPQRFNAWFRHGTSVSLADGHVKVSVPNPFTANWIEQHYQADLAELFAEQTKRELPVVVSVEASLSAQCRQRDLDIQAEMVSRATHGRSRPRNETHAPVLRHRLDDFVVGPSNKLAYSAAVAMSDGPNRHFAQLFVHGPCGVGKTHLLQGICRAVAKRTNNGHPGPRWRYVTGEQFTNEFIFPACAARAAGSSAGGIASSICWRSTTCTSWPPNAPRRKSSSTPSTRSSRPASRSSWPPTRIRAWSAT
jgi:chromosomal replication initiator protein